MPAAKCNVHTAVIHPGQEVAAPEALAFNAEVSRTLIKEVFRELFEPQGAALLARDVLKVMRRLRRNLPRRVETVVNDELRLAIEEHVRPRPRRRTSR